MKKTIIVFFVLPVVYVRTTHGTLMKILLLVIVEVKEGWLFIVRVKYHESNQSGGKRINMKRPTTEGNTWL